LGATNPTQLAAGPVFPNALPSAPAGATVGAATIQFADPHMKTPYSAQSNITIEHQLTKDMVLSASGIFSRGIHLLGSIDLNAPQPTSTYTYTITDVSGNPTGTFTTPIYPTPRPSTKYGAVYDDTNGVDSVYDGLAVTLTKQFTHGIQMLGSYTWSHQIDDGQGQASNAIFYSNVTTTYNGNNAFERGSGWLDQRHRFVYSFVWAPTVKTSNVVAKYLVNNWQLSGITTLAAGRPYTSPSIRVSSAETTIPLLATGDIDGFAGNTRAPFLPINTIFTPPSYRADARLSKIIPIQIKDRTTNLSLNFEMFNVSNSWSPTAMSSTVYVATKGVLALQAPGTYGYGTADGGFPDGTQARRMQISARFSF